MRTRMATKNLMVGLAVAIAMSLSYYYYSHVWIPYHRLAKEITQAKVPCQRLEYVVSKTKIFGVIPSAVKLKQLRKEVAIYNAEQESTLKYYRGRLQELVNNERLDQEVRTQAIARLNDKLMQALKNNCVMPSESGTMVQNTDQTLGT